jgi:hypothetical protein
MANLRLASAWTRLACAFAVGGATILPVIDLAKGLVVRDSSWVQLLSGMLLAPGAIIAVIAGGVHTYSFFVMGLGQFVFYTGAGYFLLTLLARREAKSRQRTVRQ